MQSEWVFDFVETIVWVHFSPFKLFFNSSHSWNTVLAAVPIQGDCVFCLWMPPCQSTFLILTSMFPSIFLMELRAYRQYLWSQKLKQGLSFYKLLIKSSQRMIVSEKLYLINKCFNVPTNKCFNFLWNHIKAFDT